MSDALGMSPVAMWYECYAFKITAPAATRVADKLTVFTSCCRRRFDTIGTWLRPVKMQWYREIVKVFEITFQLLFSLLL